MNNFCFDIVPAHLHTLSSSKSKLLPSTLEGKAGVTFSLISFSSLPSSAIFVCSSSGRFLVTTPHLSPFVHEGFRHISPFQSSCEEFL